MNLILFERAELDRGLMATDERARHIREVLKRQAGESFDLGVIDGPRGKGLVREIAADGAVHFTSELGAEPPLLPALELIIGLPRPQTAKKILNELTALGVAGMHFVATERSEPSYAQSTLWRDREWREHVLDGVQQAFCTRLPRVEAGRPLADVLADYDGTLAMQLALDNYEATGALGQAAFPTPPFKPGIRPRVLLAIGPERGWGPKDRAALRAAGFELVHLGERVLRVETACVAAAAIVKSRLSWM